MGASLLLPLVGAIGCGSQETGAVEHDTAALKACIYSETHTGFADGQPGLIDFVIGENTATSAQILVRLHGSDETAGLNRMAYSHPSPRGIGRSRASWVRAAAVPRR